MAAGAHNARCGFPVRGADHPNHKPGLHKLQRLLRRAVYVGRWGTDRVHEVPSRLLEKVSILDIYRSDKLGKNIKNVTFHFVYRDPRKTLAQETVDAEHARMTSEVEKRIRR